MFLTTPAAECGKLRRSGTNEGFGTPDLAELCGPCRACGYKLNVLRELLPVPALSRHCRTMPAS